MKITKDVSYLPGALADILKINEVVIRKPVVADLISAERITGKSQGFEFLSAVIALVGKFDGKTLLPEDMEKMSGSDFLSIATELELVDPQTLQKDLSTSSGKENSGKKE